MVKEFIDQYITSYPRSVERWSYDDGCVMLGARGMYQVTGEKQYLSFVWEYMDFHIKDDGSIRRYRRDAFNLDNINNGKLLFWMYDLSGEKKYLAAAETLIDQLREQPRCDCGNFFHKLIYPYQVWLDGLFMAQPFYAEYETKYHGKEGYADIAGQFRNVRQYLYVKEKDLYCHGWDESRSVFWANRDSGRSANFWLRSVGWYLAGLVDTMDQIEPRGSAFYQELCEIFRQAVDGLLRYQDQETGLFYQVIDHSETPGNYTETSGSALTAYAVLKACRMGALPKEPYEKIGCVIVESVIARKLREENGAVHLLDTCRVAGLGPADNPRRDGSVAYYLSEPKQVDDAKGTGAFIMAYAEYLRTQI